MRFSRSGALPRHECVRMYVGAIYIVCVFFVCFTGIAVHRRDRPNT